MRVKKRDGKLEDVSFDKVLRRIKFLSGDLIGIDPSIIAQKVCSQIYDQVSTSELDELAARICMSRCTDNPDYGTLGSRIIISNNQKNTPNKFSDAMDILYEAKILDPSMHSFIQKNKDTLDDLIDNRKDYDADYFAYKTLERSYLIKVKGKTIERIQHMFLRVSCGIWYPNLESVIKSYHLMSDKYFTHASPTLFNSGTVSPQLLSCFLTAPEDSIEGMYEWIKKLALISKRAGGIGGSVSCIRGNGAYIRGTNGISRGLVPLAKVANETLKHVNQGGRRAGSAAIYIEPHHPDIMEFLELKLNHGDENMRARDLFLAVWLSDLFMERVRDDADWTLMDPDECPGLDVCYGDEYRRKYQDYETKKMGKRVVKAQDIWKAITRSQIETGVPYVLFKDAANRKSNHQNLGTIRGSNLCVSPDTKILTKTGYHVIKELDGQTVNVWNGEEFSEALVKKTGEDQPMLKITFSNGAELRCTKYHRFYLSTSDDAEKPQVVEAQNLKISDKLWRCKFPVISKGTEMESPYTHGYFCAVGVDHGKRYCSQVRIPVINLRADRLYLERYLDKKMVLTTNDYGSVCCHLRNDIEDCDFVPINGSLVTKLRWLEGYCDGIGEIRKIRSNKYIQICSDNKEFLLKVHLLCQTLGVDPMLIKSENHKNKYDFLINSGDLYKLHNIGFIPKRVTFAPKRPQRESPYVKVSKIEDSENSDTYCFGEPKKNAGIFDGVYTSQCAEILEYHDSKEIASCCLSSVCLSKFVNEKEGTFDFDQLEKVTAQCVRNLNQVIDRNMYPVVEAKLSNLRHRPLGIGVQGFADTLYKLRIPFEYDGKVNPKAEKLNKDIFETMYYGAMKASLEEARKHGAYQTFRGSPLSEGKFQFNLWGVPPSDRYDWDRLRTDVMRYGVRNSLLLACMPTASTAQIMGSTETTEPMTSNLYVRRTLSGDFIISNKYLIRDLQKLGLWSAEMKNQIIAHNGSIQYIDGLPQELKDLYKTAWEIKQRTLMDLSAGRAPFICQTQSLNLFFEEPTTKILTSALFYAWKKGLKTGSYYIRSRPKTQAQQFTIDPELAQKVKQKVDKNNSTNSTNNMEIVCTDDICVSCSG